MLQPYDREELYRKVWEQPMLKVAEEYGVSSVALGKTCRKLSVPVPGRGHWAKLAHGKEGAKKPPLLKLDKIPVIYRFPVVRKKPATPDQNDPEFSAINQLLSSGALNPPPFDDSARPHPLIRHTASLLRSRSRKDENGILLPCEAGGLDVKVSEGTLERACRVMAQVLAVLERQGASLEVSEEGCTTALINGEHVSFGIEEPVRRVVTQKPRVPNPTDQWDYDKVVTHAPGGKLALVIYASTWGQYVQRARWTDAKVQRIENLVPDFVAGLMRTAVAIRRQEDERKKREAEQQKRAQERAQLQKDIQEEEKKLEQFNKWVDLFEQAERLRRFISAYAEKSRSWPAEKQPQYMAWIEWATKQADRLDPFVSEKPASVLDRKHELNAW
ncbi:MAG: hypothetical protein ACE145_13180 [Terriglobia bacterium]